MFNIGKLEELLREKLTKENSIVLALNGKWGTGKTYFWKKFIEDNKCTFEKVAYVSLFGKNTLEEIKNDVLAQVCFLNKIAENKIINVFTNSVSIFTNINLSSMLSTLKSDDFKDIVICFDDFERKSNKIDMKDIFGFISHLKEDKECKIVMIFNEDELNEHIKDKSIFKYKDKIIDYEFRFEPSVEESFNIVNQNDLKYKNNALEYFRKHNITNIRVMQRVVNALKDYEELIFNLDNNDIEKIVLDKLLSISTINAIFSIDFDKFDKFVDNENHKKMVQISTNKNDDSDEYVDNMEQDESDIYNKAMDYYGIDLDKIYISYIGPENNITANIAKNIRNYVKSSVIDEVDFNLWTEKAEKFIHIPNEISQIHEDIEFNFVCPINENVDKLFKNLLDNKNEIINILGIENFISYINFIKKYKANNDYYDEFAKDAIKIYFKPFSIEGYDRMHGKCMHVGIDSKFCSYIEELRQQEIKKLMSNPEYIKDIIKNVYNNPKSEDLKKLKLYDSEKLKNIVLADKDMAMYAYDFCKKDKYNELKDKFMDIFKNLVKSNNVDHKNRAQIFLDDVNKNDI